MWDDILGEEKFSIHANKEILERLVENAARNGGCIRVHAGEKNIQDNIKNTLNIIYNKLISLKNDIPDINYPEIRLGHCLYGLDEESIKLCKLMNVIIEVNITSNIKLKTAKYNHKLLLNTILNNDLNLVLGTDGYAIFKINSIKEYNKCYKICHNKLLVKKIAEVEKRILKKQKAIQ